MARTQLALQNTSRAGLTPSYSSATADGFAFDNESGKVILHVKNTGGSSTTVTIGGTRSVDGRTLPALTVTVGATTGDKIIGPFDPNLYNTVVATPAIEKGITVDFSVQSGVTAAAIKIAATTY